TPDGNVFWQGEAPLFGVGGKIPGGEGRVLVLADHSLFINEMMFPEDNGNVEFTSNCLEYLRGDPTDPRFRVLFIEDGAVTANFDVPVREVQDNEPLVKKLNGLARNVERVLPDVEEHDGFNRLLARFARDQLHLAPEGVWRWLLIAATVLAALYAAY